MTAFLLEMIEANLAAAAAIFIALVSRKHVLRLLGPGAAYLLWAIVPVAMLATLLPARTVLVNMPLLPQGENATLSVIADITLLVWLMGAGMMTVQMVKRQRLFMADVDLGEAGPAVVGFFRPYVVTPSDFTSRFDIHERKLILAHEQVHIERHDARINAFVALARCLFWFNPLIHSGAKAMRADQELSCDAIVMQRRPKARRVYAETLLKTQLAARPLPVGCYWPASKEHPLAERIGMLARSPFSDGRRLAAAMTAVLLIGGGGFAAWAAQPAREIVEEVEVYVPFEPLAPGARLTATDALEESMAATPPS